MEEKIITRTFATGQSDITRHESLIKKELTPNYIVTSSEQEDEWPEILGETFTVRIKIGAKVYSVEVTLDQGEGEDPVNYVGTYTIDDSINEPFPVAEDGDEVGIVSAPLIGTVEQIRLYGRQLVSPWEMGNYYAEGNVVQSGDHKYTKEYHDERISVSGLYISFEENVDVNSPYHGYTIYFQGGK